MDRRFPFDPTGGSGRPPQVSGVCHTLQTHLFLLLEYPIVPIRMLVAHPLRDRNEFRIPVSKLRIHLTCFVPISPHLTS